MKDKPPISHGVHGRKLASMYVHLSMYLLPLRILLIHLYICLSICLSACLCVYIHIYIIYIYLYIYICIYIIYPNLCPYLYLYLSLSLYLPDPIFHSPRFILFQLVSASYLFQNNHCNWLSATICLVLALTFHHRQLWQPEAKGVVCERHCPLNIHLVFKQSRRKQVFYRFPIAGLPIACHCAWDPLFNDCLHLLKKYASVSLPRNPTVKGKAHVACLCLEMGLVHYMLSTKKTEILDTSRHHGSGAWILVQELLCVNLRITAGWKTRKTRVPVSIFDTTEH